MMNKMPSTKKHLLKFLAIVPAAAVFLLAFNMVAPLRASNVDLDELKTYTRVGPDIYIKTAPTFKTACWFAPNTLTITTIAGKEESYQLDNEEDLAEVNSKYGLYLPDHEKYNKISVDALKKIKQDSPDSEVSYETFYARNPEVSEVAWLSDGKIMVKLKSGMNQVFQYGNKQDMAIAEMTYGKLPSTPPVVTRDQNPQTSGQNSNSTKELINHLKQNPTIKSVRSKVIDNKSAIVISLKGGGTEVYYLTDAASIAALKRKYSLQELPPPPLPASDAPLAAEEEQLPPPPPPVRHKKPLVPYQGAKLIEDEKSVTYILWPKDVTEKELVAAQQLFAANGFDLKLKDYKVENVGEVITIDLASRKLTTVKSSVYNLEGLALHNNVVVVRGFKESGEFFIGTTIPPDK